MDYKQCLKIHGYIAENSDSESECSNVEEIYNKYKPPPMKYDEFKHRITTVYADSLQHNTNYTNNSSTKQLYSHVAAQKKAETRGAASSVDSKIQQQLDQFTKTYQQRTDTPVRNKPTPLRTPVHQQPAIRVQTPTPTPVPNLQTATRNSEKIRPRNSPPSINTISGAVFAEQQQQPASRDITNNRTTHPQQQQQQASRNIQLPANKRTTHPLQQQEPTTDTDIAYKPLSNERTTRQTQEEEMNECCCCCVS